MIIISVNYELYKVFYHVASCLSFSQAANQLYISQSAVSQSIKSLEEELDTTLFIRNTQQVSLSKEGTKLFEHIKPAFNLIKSGEQKIAEINSFQTGEIHIGANDTISKDFLLPYLKKFHQLYPQIHIQITNRTSSTCVNLLKQGAVDFIITNMPNNKITSFMEVNQIFSFRDVFISSSKYDQLKDKTISLNKLEEYSILMLEKKTTTRKFFTDLTAKFDVDLTPEVELGSVDLLIEMARIGLGISFVPNYCIGNNTDLFKLNIKEKIPQRNLAVVTNENIPFSTASKKFMELLLNN